MSMTDPIADALTRIRNALRANFSLVVIPGSKMIVSIVEILKEEGYIEDFLVKSDGAKKSVHIALKYLEDGTPVIAGIERVSKPGRRVYCGKDEIPDVLNGLGIAIVSTSRGVMTGKKARELGVGGEVICKVY